MRTRDVGYVGPPIARVSGSDPKYATSPHCLVRWFIILLSTSAASDAGQHAQGDDCEIDSAMRPMYTLHATVKRGISGVVSISGRATSIERRRLIGRIVEEKALMKATLFQRRSLAKEFTEMTSLRGRLGPCAFATEGPNATTTNALAAAVSLNRQVHAKTLSLLINASEDIEALNRTLNPSLRVDRDILDRHLNTAHRRQIAARTASREDENEDSRHFADRYPLALPRGLANWSAFEIIFYIYWREDACEQRIFMGSWRHLLRAPMVSLLVDLIVPDSFSGVWNTHFNKKNHEGRAMVVHYGVGSVSIIFHIRKWGMRQLDKHCIIRQGKCEHTEANVRGGFEVAHLCSRAILLIWMVL